MHIKKEHFREFEWNRLIYKGPETSAGPTEAEVTTSQAEADKAFEERQKKREAAAGNPEAEGELVDEETATAETEGESETDATEEELRREVDELESDNPEGGGDSDTEKNEESPERQEARKAAEKALKAIKRLIKAPGIKKTFEENVDPVIKDLLNGNQEEVLEVATNVLMRVNPSIVKKINEARRIKLTTLTRDEQVELYDALLVETGLDSEYQKLGENEEGGGETDLMEEMIVNEQNERGANLREVTDVLHSDFDTRAKVLSVIDDSLDPKTVSAEEFAKLIQEKSPALARALAAAKPAEGPFELNEAGRKKVEEALVKELNLEGVDHVNGQELAYLRQVELKPRPPLVERLGEEGLALLSMMYKIKQEEGEKPVMVVNGEDIVLNENCFDKVLAALPQNIQDKYLASIAEGATPEDRKAYEKAVKAYGKGLEGKLQLKELLKAGIDPEGKMGTGDWISTALKLWSLLQQAMEGDMVAAEDFTDALKDAKEGRPVLKQMEAMKTEYEKAVGEMAKQMDLKTIFTLHADPKGTRANQLFGSEARYRSQLALATENLISKAFGTGHQMTEMISEEDGSMTTVNLSSGTREFQGEIHANGTVSFMEVQKGVVMPNDQEPYTLDALNGEKGFTLKDAFNDFRSKAPVPQVASNETSENSSEANA